MLMAITFPRVYDPTAVMTDELVGTEVTVYEAGGDFDGAYLLEYASLHPLLRRRIVFEFSPAVWSGEIELGVGELEEHIAIPRFGGKAESRGLYDLSDPLRVRVPGQSPDAVIRSFRVGVSDLAVYPYAKIVDVRSNAEGELVVEQAYELVPDGVGGGRTLAAIATIPQNRGERLGFGPLAVLGETPQGLTLIVDTVEGDPRVLEEYRALDAGG